jgi:hypothetical protein
MLDTGCSMLDAENKILNVIPQGTLQLSVQLSQARTKILTG